MKRILFVCLLGIFSTFSFGQEFLKGSDLSQVRAAQFSEAQITQIGKELKANQMTIEQAEPLALAKGMSASEFTQLKVRLQSNGAVPTEVKEEQKKGAGTTQEGSVLAAKNIVVFGSELFTSKSLSFEPNQNMPTPPNYILGPGDQLDVNIYGIHICMHVNNNIYRPTSTSELHLMESNCPENLRPPSTSKYWAWRQYPTLTRCPSCV